MFRTFAAALFYAGIYAFESSQWYMDNADFDAIEKSANSHYWLKGKYGPNNMGYWG